MDNKIYDVFFYKDKNDCEPLFDYIEELASKTDKNSRIISNKISTYITYLQGIGFHVREPYAKHLVDEIWELRPLNHRILYAQWDEESFILLHHFIKKTQKTPQREIDQAKRNLADFRERSKQNE